MNVKVLLLTRYDRLGASSRVRFLQCLPYLRERDVDVRPYPLFGDAYVRDLFSNGKRSAFRIAAAYWRRVLHLVHIFRFDAVWLEYEMFPWLPAWGEALLETVGVPFVVDYDDAVFHRYDLHSNPLVRTVLGRKIDRVMSLAAIVTVANHYLAERARKAGAKRVEYLPTAVDLDRYTVADRPDTSPYRIGWIGSPITARYLGLIRSALIEVCETGASEVVAIGAGAGVPKGLRVDVRAWTEETEVAEIQRCDVGIMPLPDDPPERGKSGYKLIQYMGCALPVIASPVGANRVIVKEGVNGFLASTIPEWILALRRLRDRSLRLQMGRAGRALVEREYSIQVTGPRLAGLFLDVGSRVR